MRTSELNEAAEMLALGDSYTAGTGVDPEDRWLNRVIRRLRDRGIDVADPTVIAANGWTSADLADAIERRSLENTYDIVSLLVGANDVFDGRPIAAFRRQYVDLLERAIEFAGSDPDSVLALTIPDYTPTPVGQANDPADHAERVAACNRLIETEAAERDVRTVDVVPISRRVRDEEGLVADDGLHPSPAQHELWAEAILPVAVEILGE